MTVTKIISIRFCCVFLLLDFLTNAASGVPVLQQYGQVNNDEELKLDLHQRSIVAQTALESAAGMNRAKTIYEEGVAIASPGITLQSLSTSIDKNHEHETFQSFQKYYGGEFDYADRWIQAAFDKTTLTFRGSSTTREVDFTKFNLEARSTAVRWGTLVLNIWMAVVEALEESLAELRISCASSSSTSNTTDINKQNSQQHLDRAFSFYAGSLVDSKLPLGGYFLYNLAQIQCLKFGTCKKGHVAPINTEIIVNFVLGKQNIEKGDCTKFDEITQRIKVLLKVPLIQGSLRSIYAMDREDDHRPEIQGEASAFAAALAPILSVCSQGSADIVFNDMAPGNGPTGSFEVVKSSLERHYTCMGVTCNNVGGIITLRGDKYLDRAEACGGVSPVPGAGIGAEVLAEEKMKEEEELADRNFPEPPLPPSTAEEVVGRNLLLGFLFGMVVVFVAAVIMYVRKKTRKEFDTAVDSPGKLELSGAPIETSDESGNNVLAERGEAIVA